MHLGNMLVLALSMNTGYLTPIAVENLIKGSSQCWLAVITTEETVEGQDVSGVWRQR